MKTELERALDDADREIAIRAAHLAGSVQGLLRLIDCGERDLEIHHGCLRESLARYDAAFKRRSALIDGMGRTNEGAA